MFPTPNQTAVSQSLLAEIARSGLVPDPAAFVYAVVGTLVLACLVMGYLTIGRKLR